MPPEDSKPKPRLSKKEYLELLSYSAVGIEMGAAVAIGAAIGYYLDRWIVITKPYLTLTFMLFGVVAAGKALWRTAEKMRKKLEEQEKEQNRNQEGQT